MRLTVQTGATGAVVVLDEDRTLGGRGAWLHRTETCVDNAVRRRAFNRAFRAQVDFESVVQQIKQASDLEAEHE